MKAKTKIFYTVVSILLGFLFGAIILLINGTNPLEAYKVVILGAVGKPQYISWTIIKAVPIILTGISVAFAFRTGLFNIGAEGQYIIGSIGAVLAGYLVKLPPIIHPIFCLIVGFVFGAVWGGLVGILKARFNVNEVISSIMLNWIAFYFSNYILSFPFLRKPQSDLSYSILDSAKITVLGKWKASEAAIKFLSKNPGLKQFLRPPLNWGILIAIIVAIIIWYILNRTTLGYQLKAVGFNPDAAEYGGINVKRNMATSMIISGAISGLAGAVTVLGVSFNISLMAAQQGYGFDGMAVSLIASNNPLACIPAGLLFAGLQYGGGKLTSALDTPSEVISILIGVIVLFISMPKLLEMIGKFFKKNKNEKLDGEEIKK